MIASNKIKFIQFSSLILTYCWGSSSFSQDVSAKTKEGFSQMTIYQTHGRQQIYACVTKVHNESAANDSLLELQRGKLLEDPKEIINAFTDEVCNMSTLLDSITSKYPLKQQEEKNLQKILKILLSDKLYVEKSEKYDRPYEEPYFLGYAIIGSKKHPYNIVLHVPTCCSQWFNIRIYVNETQWYEYSSKSEGFFSSGKNAGFWQVDQSIIKGSEYVADRTVFPNNWTEICYWVLRRDDHQLNLNPNCFIIK